MPKYFSIFLVAITLSAFSQESSLEFNTDIGLFNSSINSQLLSQSYGFLDEIEKSNIIDALKAENNIAFESNNAILYQNKKGWGLSLSNHIGAYATYSKSLVELSLLGNTPFKGENLKLDPFEIIAFNYSHLDFSYQWSKKIQTNVGLLLGHQFIDATVNKAYFYTHPQAAFINYQADYEAHFTDTTDLLQKPFGNKGYGAVFGMSHKDSISNGEIELSISDLGFIRWNDKTSNMHIESQYEFEGINVDDFISFSDSIIRNEIDSLQSDLQSNKKESYTWQLPTRFRLCINQSLYNSIIQGYSLSIEHRINLYNIPKLTLEVHKKMKKHRLALGYHVGGIEHNGFQFGYLYAGEKTHFHIYTKQFNAYNTYESYGVHIGVGIKRVFSGSK
ncbi:MAG: DUF5723 family protein [Bacteroidota bacterium]|nr:DUF5723 family protein [Bacteroidota bacterium]